MVHQASTLSMSPRHEQNIFHPNDREVPQILAAAWAVCTPADKPLVDQLNKQEKNFLILFSEYILTALDSPLSASDPATVLSDILMTARHRLSLLSKEVSLSPGYVVIVALLQLLANLFSADNMKYPSVASFMEAYPIFEDRSSVEKEKLFHTANWMHILFQITTAKKNKGLVMAIIPKFVEGNGVQYVTGSGQTQPTKDRVTLYETEGNVKPIKRLHRKSKQEILELAKQNGTGGNKSENKKSTKKKATYVKRKTFSDGSSSGSGRGRGRGGKQAAAVVPRPRSSRVSARASVRLSHSPSVKFFAEEEGYGQDDEDEEEDYNVEQGGDMAVDEEYEEREGGQQQHLPEVSGHPSTLMGGCESEVDSMSSNLGSSSSINNNIISSSNNNNSTNYQQYLPLPLSFAMAPPIPVRRSQSSFSQAAALIASFSTSAATTAPASYVKSPREFYLDVEANGTMRKTASASWGSLGSLASLASLGSGPSSPSGAAGGSQTYSHSHSHSHLVPDFPPSQGDQQLQMLREVSEDSDFSQQQQLSGGEGEGVLSSHLLPPHLLHQQSQSQPLSLSIPGATADSTSISASGVGSLGSPNPQPRTLERCPTSSLDEQGEVDFELLEEMTRQAGHSWLGVGMGVGVGLSLSRSTSASSLTGGGRDSAVTVTAK